MTFEQGFHLLQRALDPWSDLQTMREGLLSPLMEEKRRPEQC